jgi:hypothetical protein
MPCIPRRFTPDEQDRSFAYAAMWSGLPASLGLLISLQFGAITILTPLCSGVVAGSLIALVFSWSHDEFVRAQTAFAAHWALAYAGLILFMEVAPSLRDYLPEQRWTLAIIATIFHVALAWRRWRDR